MPIKAAVLLERYRTEIITHLAFYAGWPNAFGAVAGVKDIFAERGSVRIIP
jgi:alkylhydroperoxidase/carboxymuconolactone decarboxylase family protein YurZ